MNLLPNFPIDTLNDFRTSKTSKMSIPFDVVDVVDVWQLFPSFRMRFGQQIVFELPAVICLASDREWFVHEELNKKWESFDNATKSELGGTIEAAVELVMGKTPGLDINSVSENFGTP